MEYAADDAGVFLVDLYPAIIRYAIREDLAAIGPLLLVSKYFRIMTLASVDAAREWETTMIGLKPRAVGGTFNTLHIVATIHGHRAGTVYISCGGQPQEQYPRHPETQGAELAGSTLPRDEYEYVGPECNNATQIKIKLSSLPKFKFFLLQSGAVDGPDPLRGALRATPSPEILRAIRRMIPAAVSRETLEWSKKYILAMAKCDALFADYSAWISGVVPPLTIVYAAALLLHKQSSSGLLQ